MRYAHSRWLRVVLLRIRSYTAGLSQSLLLLLHLLLTLTGRLGQPGDMLHRAGSAVKITGHAHRTDKGWMVARERRMTD